MFVGAGEENGLRIDGVPPRAHAEAHRHLERLTVGRLAVLTRVDEDVGRHANCAADVVRLGPDRQCDRTLGDVDDHAALGDPRVAAHGRDDRQRRAVAYVDRPRRLQQAADDERTPRPGSIEEGGHPIHAAKCRRFV